MTAIRILEKNADNSITDLSIEFPCSNFAGQIPAIGDMILDPGVVSGKDRSMPENRAIWTVVGRIFNPRDNEDYVCLVVSSRAGTAKDEAFL